MRSKSKRLLSLKLIFSTNACAIREKVFLYNANLDNFFFQMWPEEAKSLGTPALVVQNRTKSENWYFKFWNCPVSLQTIFCALGRERTFFILKKSWHLKIRNILLDKKHNFLRMNNYWIARNTVDNIFNVKTIR